MKGLANNLAVKNLVLLILAAALIFSPLVLRRGAEFGGADGKAGEVIAEINPGYQPWFHSIWEPPSGEVETLFFSLQAAIGSGFIFYYLGYLRGRKKGREERTKHVQH